MLNKIKLPALYVCLFILCSSIMHGQTSDSKYTASLKDGVQKFSTAIKEKDTATFFAFLDQSLAMTARGETQVLGPDLTGFKKMAAHQFTNPEMNTTTIFQVEEVKAGSIEPVWAGYDRGMFTQTAVSKDGKYKRKVSGPYYRAWKLDNGQWKCYYMGYMAFSCEGDDCK